MTPAHGTARGAALLFVVQSCVVPVSTSHGRAILQRIDTQPTGNAQLTLPAAREHAPEWLPDLDAARAEVAEALAPGKIARVLLDASGDPAGWVAAFHDWGQVWGCIR